MEQWPDTGLPQSVRLDYEMQPRCGLLDPAEQRNSSRNRTYPEWSATFSMVVSSEQLATFRTFYDITIKQSGPFTVPWLSALGFDFHFVQFTDNGPSWNSTAKAGYWYLTLPVDIIAGYEEGGIYIGDVPGTGVRPRSGVNIGAWCEQLNIGPGLYSDVDPWVPTWESGTPASSDGVSIGAWQRNSVNIGTFQ